MAIPERTMQGMKRYIEHKVQPGGFLQAVFQNNLMEAMERADEENRDALFEICQYIYNECPSRCWGSMDKYLEWLNPKKEIEVTHGKTDRGTD